MIAYQLVGLVAFVLNVWGNWLLTDAKNRGHVVRLAANAAWIAYSPLVGAWALLGNHVVYAGINVRGWRRWKRLRVEETTHAPVKEVEEVLAENERLHLVVEEYHRRLVTEIDAKNVALLALEMERGRGRV